MTQTQAPSFGAYLHSRSGRLYAGFEAILDPGPAHPLPSLEEAISIPMLGYAQRGSTATWHFY